MFSLFRKTRDKKPTPTWLKWLLVLFVIYAFIINSLSEKSPEIKSLQNSLSPETILPTKTLEGKLLPHIIPKLTHTDLVAPPGSPATCGQTATINYKTADDKPIKETFRIGEGNIVPAIEQGIVGMTKGGKRTIFSPDNTRFELELLDITPPIPEVGAYRILGNISERGEIYHCNDMVKIKVTLWNVDGKKLYESTPPLNFTLGKSEVFLGLEQGVLGMAHGAFRHLVVPPEFQKTMNGNPPKIDFPLPKKQTVLVDIESIP